MTTKQEHALFQMVMRLTHSVIVLEQALIKIAPPGTMSSETTQITKLIDELLAQADKFGG